jgi:hypothetical protein
LTFERSVILLELSSINGGMMKIIKKDVDNGGGY